jgi:hypothetical protein
MRIHARLVFAALTAAVVLGGAVGTASARRLEISNQAIRAVWATLKFAPSPTSSINARCPVTLEGSFHSKTISKVSGQLVGYITRAENANGTVPPCRYEGGISELRILRETLPWHVQYSEFRGTLPRITAVSLRLVRASFRLRGPFGEACLYASTAAQPAFGIVTINENTGQVTGLRADETRSIPLSAPNGFCPAEGIFEGSASVTVQNTTTAITIRLVQ